MELAKARFVRERAGDACEYCGLRQDESPFARLQIEHIRPRKHGGGDELMNLALACIACNLHKGSNLAGIDPETSALTELFNPRCDTWNQHFKWEGSRIVGRTPVGRVTAQVLDLNGEDRLEFRKLKRERGS